MWQSGRSGPGPLEPDTDIGGRSHKFPITRQSAVLAARSQNQIERSRAIETIVASYWKPVYKYIRIKWHESNEDAKDLTQAFFTKALEKSFFQDYDPAKAGFRTFLRTCIDHFVANERKAAKRLKRPGSAQHLSLDFESADREFREHQMSPAMTTEEYFEREWLRSLFSLAVESLRRECRDRGKALQFELFEIYDLEDNERRLTYDQLAVRLNISVSNVTNYLSFSRREFKRIVLEKLRELTANDDEFRREAQKLLGVDIQ
jgi:RNA polymerase sigma factor (sigma-70 family)